MASSSHVETGPEYDTDDDRSTTNESIVVSTGKKSDRSEEGKAYRKRKRGELEDIKADIRDIYEKLEILKEYLFRFKLLTRDPDGRRYPDRWEDFKIVC